MNGYTSVDQQRAYADYVMVNDYDKKPREIRIREAAADVLARSEVYGPRGDAVIIRLPRREYARPFVAEGGRLPPPAAWDTRYVDIRVRLAPELQASDMKYIAQILVENQLRAEWP